MRPFLAMPIALMIAIPALLAEPQAASAEQFEFAPPSHIKLNRIYRIDTLNGEITACQYGATEGSIGVTICYPSGDGATAQAPGDYGLIASHHVDDGGIFRVNKRNGDVSICFGKSAGFGSGILSVEGGVHTTFSAFST